MSIEFLDPTHENETGEFQLAPRIATFENQIVAVISNGKKGTIPFFDAFEQELIAKYRVAEVVRLTKSNYSTPAETELLSDAQRWNILVAGVGD